MLRLLLVRICSYCDYFKAENKSEQTSNANNRLS